MPRTAIVAQTPPGAYPSLPIGAGGADFTFGATDNVNGNSFVATGRELVLVRNPTGGALTLTVKSVTDQLGRSGDITTYSVGAGLFSVFGPIPVSGWRQSDGNVYLDFGGAGLTIAVLRLPPVS